MKDLIVHDPDFSLNDVHLMKIGRHFRFSPKLRLVVGRNEDENQKIQTFSKEADILLKICDHPGPLSLLRGDASLEEIDKAGAITVRYSKAKDSGKVEVDYRKAGEKTHQSISVSPISEEQIRNLLVGE